MPISESEEAPVKTLRADAPPRTQATLRKPIGQSITQGRDVAAPATSAPPRSRVRGVRVRRTHLGWGAFASRDFPAEAVVGEIRGELIEDPDYSSDYAFDFGDGLSLEPSAPFRFLNHSCEPNCEFIWVDDEEIDDLREARQLMIVALREIYTGEELTIDYAWGADSAIPCLCEAPSCRGYIVCEEELHHVRKRFQRRARVHST